MNRTLAQVIDELETVEDVATLLESKGIRGSRGDSCDCPIAVYVRHETGSDRVEVGNLETVTVSLDADGFPRLDAAYNPENIRSFLEDFDDGDYPHLETSNGSHL